MPGSQITTILTNIATTLDSVTGVQRVYTYEPAILAPGNIPAILGGSQALDYWTVRPETTQPRRLTGYQVELDHVILMTHYYNAGDTSITEPLLDPIVVAVMDKFVNTFAVVPQAEMTGPPEVTWPMLWRLGETFVVWKTEFRLPVKELYTVQ